MRSEIGASLLLLTLLLVLLEIDAVVEPWICKRRINFPESESREC